MKVGLIVGFICATVTTASFSSHTTLQASPSQRTSATRELIRAMTRMLATNEATKTIISNQVSTKAGTDEHKAKEQILAILTNIQKELAFLNPEHLNAIAAFEQSSTQVKESLRKFRQTIELQGKIILASLDEESKALALHQSTLQRSLPNIALPLFLEEINEFKKSLEMFIKRREQKAMTSSGTVAAMSPASDPQELVAAKQTVKAIRAQLEQNLKARGINTFNKYDYILSRARYLEQEIQRFKLAALKSGEAYIEEADRLVKEAIKALTKSEETTPSSSIPPALPVIASNQQDLPAQEINLRAELDKAKQRVKELRVKYNRSRVGPSNKPKEIQDCHNLLKQAEHYMELYTNTSRDPVSNAKFGYIARQIVTLKKGLTSDSPAQGALREKSIRPLIGTENNIAAIKAEIYKTEKIIHRLQNEIDDTLRKMGHFPEVNRIQKVRELGLRAHDHLSGLVKTLSNDAQLTLQLQSHQVHLQASMTQLDIHLKSLKPQEDLNKVNQVVQSSNNVNLQNLQTQKNAEIEKLHSYQKQLYHLRHDIMSSPPGTAERAVESIKESYKFFKFLAITLTDISARAEAETIALLLGDASRELERCNHHVTQATEDTCFKAEQLRKTISTAKMELIQKKQAKPNYLQQQKIFELITLAVNQIERSIQAKHDRKEIISTELRQIRDKLQNATDKLWKLMIPPRSPLEVVHTAPADTPEIIKSRLKQARMELSELAPCALKGNYHTESALNEVTSLLEQAKGLLGPVIHNEISQNVQISEKQANVDINQLIKDIHSVQSDLLNDSKDADALPILNLPGGSGNISPIPSSTFPPYSPFNPQLAPQTLPTPLSPQVIPTTPLFPNTISTSTSPATPMNSERLAQAEAELSRLIAEYGEIMKHFCSQVSPHHKLCHNEPAQRTLQIEELIKKGENYLAHNPSHPNFPQIRQHLEELKKIVEELKRASPVAQVAKLVPSTTTDQSGYELKIGLLKSQIEGLNNEIANIKRSLGIATPEAQHHEKLNDTYHKLGELMNSPISGQTLITPNVQQSTIPPITSTTQPPPPVVPSTATQEIYAKILSEKILHSQEYGKELEKNPNFWKLVKSEIEKHSGASQTQKQAAIGLIDQKLIKKGTSLHI